MNYFSTQETAKILGYNDDSYIRKLISIGKIEAIRIGKNWGISEETIHQFKVEKLIQNHFKKLFLHNHKLKMLSDKYIDNPLSINSSRHAICHMFLGKSYKTFSATISLCEKGFGEDAVVLLRTLFENLVNLQYILSSKNDYLAERYLSYDYVMQKMMLDYVKQKPNLAKLIKERESKKLSGDMTTLEINSKAAEVMKKYKFNIKIGWSGISINKMSKLVGRNSQYKTIYRLQCQLSHPSVRGMNVYFDGKSDKDNFVMNIGTNENYIEESLVAAFDFFSSILSTVGNFMKWNIEKDFDDLVSEYISDVKKINEGMQI